MLLSLLYLVIRMLLRLLVRDGQGEAAKDLAGSCDPVERKMFGGIAFMVGGHMACGVLKQDLVLGLSEEGAAQAWRDPNVRPMDFTGRPMKQFLFVSPKGVA